MPSNTYQFFLVACVGLSVFYIVGAWTWCRRGSGGKEGLRPGPTSVVVVTTWLGLLAVFSSLFFLTYARAAMTANHESKVLEIEGQRLRQSLLSSPRYASAKRLNNFESKAYSQNGEDGVIAEIFRRIGVTNRGFVEFGASDGSENNTVLLLRQGWSGQWVEGDPEVAARARASYAPEVESGRLVVTEAFITAENAEELLKTGNAPAELDLFSLDIDRNDYYVWEAIRNYRPRVVIVEYNPIFPPGVDWVVEYDAAKWWNRTSHYGASLTAYERLGRDKGYVLVGCELTGVNAFFVRSDLAGELFEAPYTAQNHYEPPRSPLIHSWGGHPRRP